MPWKMSCAAMLTFITGSVPALQSAMTHRITTASVSIEVSLKRRIPFQSASWPKNPNSCKSGKIQKNNPVLCLLLILSLYSIQKLLSLANKGLTRHWIVVSTFEKGFQQKLLSVSTFEKATSAKMFFIFYFWKSKLKINICRVYFSWLLHCTPLNLRVIENYSLHKHEYCQKMLLY